MSKREAYAAISERLTGQPAFGPDTSAWRQIRCALSAPLFRHPYDAIFVPRPDKSFSYYEHCVWCGRARSWIAMGNNHGKPGSVHGGRYEERV